MAVSKKIETLVPKVRREAPSCPSFLAIEELRNTLIDFCVNTDIYLQDLTLLQVVKNLNEYSSSDLDIPVGTELNHIIDITDCPGDDEVLDPIVKRLIPPMIDTLIDVNKGKLKLKKKPSIMKLIMSCLKPQK